MGTGAISHSACSIGASLEPLLFPTELTAVHAQRRYHNPEANLEEGLATLRRCIDEVSKRLVVSPGKYKVKIVDKDGVREVDI
jgi:hypothetical protein